MSKEMGTCKTCEHWKEDMPYIGECHNRSPVVDPRAFIGGSYGTGETIGPRTFWPRTEDNDWCGDHIDKINAAR